MQLTDITMNSKVTIEVRKNGKGANFVSKPELIRDDCVYIEPIRYGSKLLSFDIEGLKIEVVVTREGEYPVRFKNIRIVPERIDGRLYHCIASKTNGIKSERRSSVRVFVGEQGTVSEGVGGRSENVFVKDISDSGISFIISPKIKEYSTGESVKVHYSDSEIHFSVDVDTKIVRTENADTGRLYGCQFTRNYPQVVKYVSAKQINEQRKRREMLRGKK